MLNRRPGVHSAGCWLSLQHLISIFNGPQFIRASSPFVLVWLSLPHLVSNWLPATQLATPLIRAQMAPLAWCSFPYHISLELAGTPTQLTRRTLLNYIIVRRPLDLWNRMFNYHQAEITVMQFTGHSLPVHQSMSVPWEFFNLVPFHQPISAYAISSHNCH